MFSASLVALFFTGAAFALPPGLNHGGQLGVAKAPKTGCSITAPSFAGLATPADSQPILLGLGVGVQNYTCGAAGTFASAGAVAELYDISCLQGNSKFATIQDIVVAAPDKAVSAIEAALSGTTAHLGQHYFVTNAAGGISPKFDFAPSGKGYVIAKKIANVVSPGGSVNVDWLQLDATEGTLAKHVFRLDTALGQPAASCTAGATTSVKYAAKYYFYN